MHLDELKHREQTLLERERALTDKFGRGRQVVFERFPLVFTLLGTFGVVATFYGFEALIDRVDVFRDNPLILLGTGIATLVLTGSLYKKLQ